MLTTYWKSLAGEVERMQKTLTHGTSSVAAESDLQHLRLAHQ